MSTIEIRGYNELKAIIAGIEPAINAALQALGIEIKGRMAEYPSAIPNSRYRRTGTLGRKWTMKVGPFMVTIGNNTDYGPYVQERARQAEVHRGRWATTDDVTEEFEPKAEKLFEANVQKVLNK